MNLLSVTSLLLCSIAFASQVAPAPAAPAAPAKPTTTESAKTADKVADNVTKTAQAPAAAPVTPTPTQSGTRGAESGIQGFLNLNLRIGPLNMEMLRGALDSSTGLAGGRLAAPAGAASVAPATPAGGAAPAAPATAPAAPGGAPVTPAVPAAPGAAPSKDKSGRYLPRQDERIKHLIFLGTREENAKFEREAATLHKLKAKGGDAKIIADMEKSVAEETRRRQEIYAKTGGAAAGKASKEKKQKDPSKPKKQKEGRV